MVLRLTGGAMISVELPTGRQVYIDVSPASRIGQVKARIQEQEGIPAVQQILMLGNTKLKGGMNPT